MIQIAQEFSFPVVPDFRTGAAHVGHGQEIEIVQSFLVTNLGGELVDNLGVGNVLALRDPGHQKMRFDQPGHEIGIVVTEVV